MSPRGRLLKNKPSFFLNTLSFGQVRNFSKISRTFVTVLILIFSFESKAEKTGIFLSATCPERQVYTSNEAFLDSLKRCMIFPDDEKKWVQADHCDVPGYFCLPGSFQQIAAYQIFDNGQFYDGDLSPCDVDTSGVYFFQNIFGQGNLGPYRLNSWRVGGVTLSGNFATLSDLADLMNRLDPGGDWVYNAPSFAIFGGSAGRAYGQMQISDLNFGVQSTHDYTRTFPSNGFALAVEKGLHEIIIIDFAEMCSDTLEVEVVCTKNDTVFVQLQSGEKDTICLELKDLAGGFSVIYNDCPPQNTATLQLMNGPCFEISGNQMGQEIFCMVVCDDFGICDTTFVVVTVFPPPGPGTIVRDTISAGQSVRLCLDTSDLKILGRPVFVENICPELSGFHVSFFTDTTSFCVEYEGLEPGSDTACIVFCDSIGFCDTIPFFISVLPSQFVFDTIYLGANPQRYCVSTALLPGSNIDLVNDCAGASGTQVEFTLENDSLCVNYFGVGLGADTACLVLQDEFGNQERFLFIVEVVTTHPETFCDTIFINETKEFCHSTDELPAGTIVLMENFCPQLGTGNVSIFIGQKPACFQYTGRETGTDTACIIVCDESGVCDTTRFCFTVVEYFAPPVANPDADTTGKGVAVIIDVEKNDTLFGRVPACATIVRPPRYGTAVVSQDCTVSYFPDAAYCERTDDFVYEICNENGCDTALVEIFIKCSEVTVFTAVSPNSDGVNDVFFISGLDDRPDNHLKIFNRWGSLVFEKNNYQNDWDATWNGKVLPDGTYYYILEIGDNGSSTHLKGYIEVYR